MAGIYIHIPFCKQACTYCNFHFSTSLSQKNNVLSALQQEIILTPFFKDSNENIETIYFGGGTPSLLSADELQAIMSAIKKKFTVDETAEITLEANPDDINMPTISAWRKLGINRLSLGVQSFDATELRWMNRAHHADESLAAIRMIKEAGFENFSIDLIYGSPLQPDATLLKNLSIIFEEQVPHISCYALTVENKTALQHLIEIKKSPAVDAEKQARQFLLLMDKMQEAGYEQYEISNFSKPAQRSRHNSSYWQGKAYYGFGPAAHSFDGNKTRRWNIANNALYVQSILQNSIPFEEELLTATQQLNEYIMTALRTMEGINLDQVELLAGNKKSSTIKTFSKKYIESGKMRLHGNYLQLTKAGRLFADGIAADLFFTDDDFS